MNPKKFDSIIIGSGQAGNPLAFALADAGERVALIEKGKVGGTCVNVGCTPTKTYVAMARIAFMARRGAKFGLELKPNATFDLGMAKRHKDALVDRARKGLKGALETKRGITLIKGAAIFTEPHSLQVGKDLYQSDKIFINVGSRPRIIDGFAEVKYLTNESILELTELPKHLIIVGGSYVGLEFAQMFRRFGSQVTVVEKGDRIISREDPETSAAVMGALHDEGIEFRLEAECIGGKAKKNGQIEVSLNCHENPKIIRGSHVLLAIGRQSNADLLAPDKAEILLDERGFIPVNDQLETSKPGHFALGDCNGQGAFTHTAYNDFEIIAANQLRGEKRSVKDRILTYALYTDPPLGRAGLSLNQALDAGYEVLYGRMDMADISRAKEMGETVGFMEVVIDKKKNTIIGATVMGPGGDEIISLFLTAMYACTDYSVLARAVFPHPTISELIITLLQHVKEQKRKRRA